MSLPSPDVSSPVQLRLNAAGFRLRVFLNALFGVMALLLYVALVSQAEMFSGPLLLGLVLLGLEVRLGFRIASHLRVLHKARQCQSPQLAWDSTNLHISSVFLAEQSIPLQRIARCVVKERERRWGKSHWNLVIEEQRTTGLVLHIIEDDWFPGGESQMRSVAEAIEQPRKRQKKGP